MPTDAGFTGDPEAVRWQGRPATVSLLLAVAIWVALTPPLATMGSVANQGYDAMFWPLGSAITVATAYQMAIFSAMVGGDVPNFTFAENLIWCLASLALIPMWSSLYSFWVHRMEHHPKLYARVHKQQMDTR